MQADDGFVASRNLWPIILNNKELCVSELRSSVITAYTH